MIVVDASAILELLLARPAGARIRQRLFTGGERLCAPDLLDIEVAQVLRRCYLLGELSGERGLQALQLMVDFPLTRYAHDPLLLRIWALRHNVTAYDAAYLALAEALGATLVTCDRALLSAPGHAAAVEFF